MDESDVFILLVFGSLIASVVIFSADTFMQEHSTTFEDTYLRSLQDGSAIHGSFSLGSGSIRESPQFVFYAIDGNGYVLKTLPADKSKIIEDEEINPYVRTYKNCETGFIFKSTYCWDVIHEFHVPKETVIQQWNLDGQLR